MSLLDLLSKRAVWERFYEYKTSLACPKSFAKELREFIDGEAYLPVCEAIGRSERFALASKSVIGKLGSQKKRTVYTYPSAENTVLKLLTFLLLRRYDGVFEPSLYSFRPRRTAKDAICAIRRLPDVAGMYSYKVDVADYFNSVPVERLIPILEETLGDDVRLFSFLRSLLEEPYVLDRGEVISERKGIMAGTPQAAFYANLYLAELDRRFAGLGAAYARYSDDIIILSKSRAEVERLAEEVRRQLNERGLAVNPAKERFASPEDGFEFLGFSVRENVVDIAPSTVKKLKGKMRRKRDALARWAKRNEADGERAARAFIRIFKRKLLEGAADSELTWSLWFFPVITTAKTLGEIDRYAEDCVRYLVSGTHTKARYNVRYADLKALGFKSLVHEYYSFRKKDKGDNGK